MPVRCYGTKTFKNVDRKGI
jgi:hypothetical protein